MNWNEIYLVRDEIKTKNVVNRFLSLEFCFLLVFFVKSLSFKLIVAFNLSKTIKITLNL